MSSMLPIKLKFSLKVHTCLNWCTSDGQTDRITWARENGILSITMQSVCDFSNDTSLNWHFTRIHLWYCNVWRIAPWGYDFLCCRFGGLCARGAIRQGGLYVRHQTSSTKVTMFSCAIHSLWYYSHFSHACATLLGCIKRAREDWKSELIFFSEHFEYRTKLADNSKSYQSTFQW